MGIVSKEAVIIAKKAALISPSEAIDDVRLEQKLQELNLEAFQDPAGEIMLAKEELLDNPIALEIKNANK